MLEGLEAIEVNLTKTIENKDFRIDSDFWTKEPRQNPKLKYAKIGEILKSAQYGISVSMNEDNIGYPIYRMNEIHNMMCDLDVDKYADISKKDFEQFRLKDKDVLFNRTNSYEWVGRTGIYRKNNKQDYTFASYLVRFIPNENIINPEYLTTYLNTKYGIWDVKRRSRHSINQTNVNPEEVKEIFIPLLNNDIQNFIKDNFEKAHLFRLKSQELYNQAESLLLETIGLKNFKPSTDPINIKNYKDSFLTTGRLDSEYYQKKYEEVVNHIKEQKHDILSNIVKIKKSIEPGSDAYSDEGLPFLRVADYNKFGINRPEKKISNSFCKANKDLITDLKPKKETILFSKDGTLGLAYMLRQDEEMITSGAILHLTVKDKSSIIPEYLTLVLNSILVIMQAERDSGGSIILHWRINEIENVIVPIIDYAKQQKIAELVEESFGLKKQSERLLNTAKRAVEIAIEQNESESINYIHKNIDYEKENKKNN
ncbi:MAG: restriction endonuclease subunit S [Bacteroidetes bacterium]|nr:restriction endonuclease subunit S [Bacteroidota bacterium]